MKEVKIIVRDLRKEIPKSLMEELETEFLTLQRQEVKQEKEEESSNEVKNDPDQSFLFAYEKEPKMPKKEVKRLEVKSKTKAIKFSNYQCKICQKYLSDKSILKKHFELHFKPKNYKCKICKKVFVMEHNFKAHKCIKDLTCQHCNLNFTKFFSLKFHVSNVHKLKMPDDKFCCDSCGAYLKEKRNLALHVLKCSTGKYFCDHCDKKFSFRSEIRQHVLNHAIHQVECEVCLSKMKPGYLRAHIASFHPKFVEKFECKKCLKVFQTARVLKAHAKNHDKKFQCPYCNFKFRAQGDFNQHKIFHENTRKFQCRICGHQLKNKGNLKVHLRGHDKNHVKRFQCNFCDFKTDGRINFENHKIIHQKAEEKLKKYPNSIKCTKCFSVLKNERIYKDHLRYKHGDKQKFQCDLCKVSCVAIAGIKKHLMNKHLNNVK